MNCVARNYIVNWYVIARGTRPIDLIIEFLTVANRYNITI